MTINYWKHLAIIIGGMLVLSMMFIILPTKRVNASSYDGNDLVLAILTNSNQSTVISSHYVDSDSSGQHLQAKVVSALGSTGFPTDGSTFIVLSNGKAGAIPVMTESGSDYHTERGTWFGQQRPGSGGPFDHATLTIQLQVPPNMNYLDYSQQFFTTEYPDYNGPGTVYNDKLTVTVNSPHQGITTYVTDVKSGDFVYTADDIPGTGFDVFAKTNYAPHSPTNPADVDWIDTTPGLYHGISCADAGATALVGREHNVSPNEIITITFDIRDAGDNQFDSAVFIDNLHFESAESGINARKTVQDVSSSPPKPGDILGYTVTITKIGRVAQADNPGNEFEDAIPQNTVYIPGSAHAHLGSGSAEYGSTEYVPATNKIIWNGKIPELSTVRLEFQVTINMGLVNGTKISNRGIVHWDSDDDKSNDATIFTNFANVTVSSYEAPTSLTEDFSDDTSGEKATESYQGNMWFETSKKTVDSNFEVASSYHYSTPKSFKAKLRASCGTQYWNYSATQFNSTIKWWEVWFACGNASESSDLLLEFKNTNGNTIARMQFDYIHIGTNPPSDYAVKLSYANPSGAWVQLNSAHSGGYLDNGWYKLRIEKNGANALNYSLYQGGQGLTDTRTDGTLGSPFSNLARVEWHSTKNPIVCPIFFWDEHTVGLSTVL